MDRWAKCGFFAEWTIVWIAMPVRRCRAGGFVRHPGMAIRWQSRRWSRFRSGPCRSRVSRRSVEKQLDVSTRTSFGHSSQRQQRQKDALESQVASTAVEPLLQGVGSATHAATADGDGFPAQRQWNIGVRGGALDLCRVAQVRIHGANHLQDSSVAIQFARGSIANGDDLATESGRALLRWVAPLAEPRFFFDGTLERQPQGSFETLHLSHRSGSNVDPHAG